MWIEDKSSPVRYKFSIKNFPPLEIHQTEACWLPVVNFGTRLLMKDFAMLDEAQDWAEETAKNLLTEALKSLVEKRDGAK